jgi:hypothetical protein
MKFVLGVVLGTVGYAAWALSEPEDEGPADFSARMNRLRQEWRDAVTKGKVAGEDRRVRMEQELDAVFRD